VSADEGHVRFMMFDMISQKGSAIFKGIVNKLD